MRFYLGSVLQTYIQSLSKPLEIFLNLDLKNYKIYLVHQLTCPMLIVYTSSLEPGRYFAFTEVYETTSLDCDMNVYLSLTYRFSLLKNA